MATNNYLDDGLVENENIRQPICFCLDVSTSMKDDIGQLNKNVAMFYKQLMEHESTRDSAEVAIVTFGETVSVYEGFSALSKKNPPTLSADGLTPMGEGVQLALKILGDRKKEYKAHSVDYLQPWLIIMSDGSPYGGDMALVPSMQAECMKLIKSNKLLVISIGIGSADMKILQAFSEIKVFDGSQENDFTKFFKALAMSVAAVLQNPEKTAKEIFEQEINKASNTNNTDEDDGWAD